MNEKRMMIVDTALIKKIDENRGDMSISDFISFLIDNQLRPTVAEPKNNHVTKEEFQQFEQGIKDLLRNFLEFFLSYGLEFGRHSAGNGELEQLEHKLQTMGLHSKKAGKS